MLYALDEIAAMFDVDPDELRDLSASYAAARIEAETQRTDTIEAMKVHMAAIAENVEKHFLGGPKTLTVTWPLVSSHPT